MGAKGYAAETLDDVMTGLAPVLAQHGFKRAGRCFRRRDADLDVALSLEGFRDNRFSSDGGGVEFRLRLLVYCRRIDEVLDRPVERKPTYGHSWIYLAGNRHSTVFLVFPRVGVTLDEVVALAVERFTNDGVPWLAEHDSLAALDEEVMRWPLLSMEQFAFCAIRGDLADWWRRYDAFLADVSPAHERIADYVRAELERLNVHRPG